MISPLVPQRSRKQVARKAINDFGGVTNNSDDADKNRHAMSLAQVKESYCLSIYFFLARGLTRKSTLDDSAFYFGRFSAAAGELYFMADALEKTH
jgi:hypothetical protein